MILNEKQKMDSLLVTGIEINRIHDLDILLERLLTRARQFVNADAGSIYIREGRSTSVRPFSKCNPGKKALPR